MRSLFSLFLILIGIVPIRAQSESDSVFRFDYQMNWTESKGAKWIALKEKLEDSVFMIDIRPNAFPQYYKPVMHDKYSLLPDEKMLVRRTFFKKGESLPGEYAINVDILSFDEELYRLDVYSKDLNIHKTVFSKTLVPICPIIKTVEYHPNCSVSKLNFHDERKDSLWNANGEIISKLAPDWDIDELPIIEGFEEHTFERGFSMLVQQELEYPEEALNANIEGRVYTSFIITTSGTVEHLKVVRGVHPLIDNSSLEVLRKLKIAKPAMKNGEPVNLKLTYPFEYHIQ
ncbi:MAG: energy transducer TonB [Crocinitomicaceae bacterium]